MNTLTQSTDTQIVQIGRRILNEYRSSAKSFDQAAHAIVRELFGNFRQPNGDPMFALLRVFRFGRYGDLSDNLRHMATDNDTYWLTLMATIGIEPAWCDVNQSKGHRVIPADNPKTPMLAAAFQQIGLPFGKDDPERQTFQTQIGDNQLSRYFHVETASDSPFIPIQDGFVKRYGVESVVGIGSGFLGGDAFFCIGFSLSKITEADAKKFAILDPYIATLLALYNRPECIY